MQAVPTAFDDALFFRDTVVRYVDLPRFVRRDWLASEVAKQLTKPSCRIVLLTGEPGCGKSGFVAQLADEHPHWPVYFLRRDHRAVLEDASAKSFLLSIGLQLAAARPELFSAEQVRLVVEQRIGEIEGGGAATAARVDKVLASPFHQAVVHIRQTVERRAAGEVVGLSVGELIANPRLIDVDDLAAMALFDPARVLERLRPDEQIEVLIDALDERPEQPGEQTLVDWLTRVALPVNVRIVATSRPDEPRLAALAGQHGAGLAALSIDSDDPRVRQDLRAYAAQLVATGEIRQALLDSGRDPEVFADNLVEKADGNLGYLDAIARAVLPADGAGRSVALPDLLELTRLPAGLRELHAFFLLRIRTGPGAQVVHVEDAATGTSGFLEAWAGVYRPLLELLCIAREPLRLDVIIGLSRSSVDPSYVAGAVQHLRHVLDLPAQGYRLYHATVSEFLVSDATWADPSTAELYVDQVAAHGRLAARLRRRRPQHMAGRAAAGCRPGTQGVRTPPLRGSPLPRPLMGCALRGTR